MDDSDFNTKHLAVKQCGWLNTKSLWLQKIFIYHIISVNQGTPCLQVLVNSLTFSWLTSSRLHNGTYEKGCWCEPIRNCPCLYWSKKPLSALCFHSRYEVVSYKYACFCIAAYILRERYRNHGVHLSGVYGTCMKINIIWKYSDHYEVTEKEHFYSASVARSVCVSWVLLTNNIAYFHNRCVLYILRSRAVKLHRMPNPTEKNRSLHDLCSIAELNWIW